MNTPPHLRYGAIYTEINELMSVEGRWDNVVKDLIHSVKEDKDITIPIKWFYTDKFWLSCFTEPCYHSDEEICEVECTEENAIREDKLYRGIRSYIWDIIPSLSPYKDPNWEYIENSQPKLREFPVVPNLSYLP